MKILKILPLLGVSIVVLSLILGKFPVWIMAPAWLLIISDLSGRLIDRGAVSIYKQAFYMAVAPSIITVVLTGRILPLVFRFMLEPSWPALGVIVQQRPVLAITIIYLACVALSYQIKMKEGKENAKLMALRWKSDTERLAKHIAEITTKPPSDGAEPSA